MINSWIERFRPHRGPVLLLIIAVFVVYGRILGHDFIPNWDDKLYVTDNADLLSFSWENIRTVFSSYYVGNYAPLQMLSYMLDYTLWGLWPGGFLFTNIVIHVMNGLLLYWLFLKWYDNRLLAMIGAAFFLLHPVQVESVAWVSQRKNLLAMFFFLLAWEEYCRYREAEVGKGKFAYAASVVVYVLSVLAKSASVIFPVVVVLFDLCYPSKDRRVRLLDKLPYILAAGVIAAVAMQSQMPDLGVWGQGGGRATEYYGGNALATFFTMLPVFCRYLGMLVWPTGLSAEYNPPIHDSLDATVVMAGFLLAVIALLSFRLFRADRRKGFWPCFFLIAFLPVSQIVPLVTLMNDRYLYFPMIAIAGLTGAGAVFLHERIGMHRIRFSLLLALPLILLAGVSFQRASVWQNEITLWRDAVRKSPNKSITWERLGEAAHRFLPATTNEALYAYKRALELDPSSDLTRYNLGILYTDIGEIDKGFETFTALLQHNPNNVMGLAALGEIFQYRGDYDKAEKAFKRAHAVQPESVQVLTLLGNLALIQGRLDQARDYYSQIEKQRSNDPQVAFQLACIESMAGQAGASVLWLERSLQCGYHDYNALMASEELAPIRADLRFTELMQRYFPK